MNWPHKNHFRLLEAFRLVGADPRLSDVRLILTGAECVEPRTHFYKELLDQPWARDRVVDLGYVTNVQLFLLMSGAEAFVFPSMYEGFGIPVLEAMRIGTPVIAADLPVIREWFGGCYEPFADIRDSYRMAEDLRRFLEDPQARAELGEAGRVRSMDFSSTRSAQETFRFLSQVADNFGRSEPLRGRPFRDAAAVRAKDCRLLFHVLVGGGGEDEMQHAAAALAALSEAGEGHFGFVFLVPYEAGRPALPDAPRCAVLYFERARARTPSPSNSRSIIPPDHNVEYNHATGVA